MRSLDIPRIVHIGKDALARIAPVVDRLGLGQSRGMYVTGERNRQTLLSAGLVSNLEDPFVPGASTTAEADVLVEHLDAAGAEFVVGVGGGRTLDIAKYAAAKSRLPFVAVATNLAHDGIASPVAVLERDGHRHSLAAVTPDGVIVDLSQVAADDRAWRAGVGDVVSNICAVNDWNLADSKGIDEIDGLAASMAASAADAVLFDTRPSGSEDFLEGLARSLILSGIAMSTAGSSRPSSGGDHEISHAIDALFPGDRLHGEQAAVGTMFCEFIRDGSDFEAIDDCFRRHSVPRLPADIGLTAEQFAEAIDAAPSTRPGRFTILEERAMTADEITHEVKRFHAAVD